MSKISHLMDAMEARPGVLEALAWGPEPSLSYLDDVPTQAIADAASLARINHYTARARWLEAEYRRRTATDRPQEKGNRHARRR